MLPSKVDTNGLVRNVCRDCLQLPEVPLAEMKFEQHVVSGKGISRTNHQRIVVIELFQGDLLCINIPPRHVLLRLTLGGPSTSMGVMYLVPLNENEIAREKLRCGNSQCLRGTVKSAF